MNPVVEGFRGAAALAVLLHHYSYLVDERLTGGWLHFFHSGVDLFFVITGYLFASQLTGESTQSVLSFATRRAFRLYPLYLVSIAVGVLAAWGEREGLAVATIKHLLFAQTAPGNNLNDASYFSQVYWTMPVEVQFYAFVAVVMAIRRYARVRLEIQQCRSVSVAVLGVLAILTFLVSWLPGHDPRDEAWVIRQAQLPALLLSFWFGTLVHHFEPSLRARRRLREYMVLLGVVLLSVLFLHYPIASSGALTARPFGLFNLLCAMGYAMLLACCTSSRWRSDSLMTRLALWLGSLSYAVYLFHEWALKLVLRLLPTADPITQILFALLLVLGLAALMNRMIEAPLRSYGRMLSKRIDPPSGQASRRH